MSSELNTRICLSTQQLETLIGSSIPGVQAAYLDDLGVPYIPRPDGSLGVLRNAIEKRLAELRQLWRQYCEQFAEYEDALEAFESRTRSPWSRTECYKKLRSKQARIRIFGAVRAQ